MKNVLINAYACAPHKGSEPGLAWNWIVNIAESNNVFIITEGEWKKEISEALRNIPHRQNFHFYYIPVNEKVREMCWNQGDWRFYYYYKKWQKKAYLKAIEILSNNKIDIIHQLGMIGFQEPGYLWKIKTVPTIWGPVGGFSLIPFSFLSELSFKNKVGWILKNVLHYVHSRTSVRVRKAINKSDVIIAATPLAYREIRRLSNYKKEIYQIPETGTYDIMYNRKYEIRDRITIAWIGKMDERKALPLALKSIAKLKPNANLELNIYGDGRNFERYKALAKQLKVDDKCIWHGNVAKSQVLESLKSSDLFFLTSLSDATTSVVLEALTFGVPVLCHDNNGYGQVIDDSCGIKIPFESPQKSIINFSNALSLIINDRDMLSNLAKGARIQAKKYTWESNAKKMFNYYSQVLEKGSFKEV